jgi:hypothetical protein
MWAKHRRTQRLGASAASGVDWEKMRPSGFHVRKLEMDRRAHLRLACDPFAGEPLTTKSFRAVREAWISLAMSRIMLRRLAQNSS